MGGALFRSDLLRSVACQHVTHIWIQGAKYRVLLHEPPLNCVWCIAIVLFLQYIFLKFYGPYYYISYNTVIEVLFTDYNAWYFLYKGPWEKFVWSWNQKGYIFLSFVFLYLFVSLFGVILWKFWILWLPKYSPSRCLPGSSEADLWLTLHLLHQPYASVLFSLLFFSSTSNLWAFAILCK